MITISAVDFDIDGFVRIQPGSGSNFGQYRRRQTRTSTLDGGATATDHGYSDSDRTWSIDCWPSKEDDKRLTDLVRFHRAVQVSSSEGFYLAQMDYKSSKNKAQITLRILQRLDED